MVRFKNFGALKTAATWLYLVAAATAINSIILNRNHRFIDLLAGLSFTQFVDAAFLGLGVEPQGSPDWFADALPALLIDALFVCVLIALAVKVSHGSCAAAKVGLWLYSLDTLVFGLVIASNVRATVNGTFHTPATTLTWEGATVVAHIVGIFVMFHAVRADTSKVQTIPQ
jgi:hypothetical protein